MKTILGTGAVLCLAMSIAACGDDSSNGDIANCGAFCNVAQECGGEDRNCMRE